MYLETLVGPGDLRVVVFYEGVYDPALLAWSFMQRYLFGALGDSGSARDCKYNLWVIVHQKNGVYEN